MHANFATAEKLDILTTDAVRNAMMASTYIPAWHHLASPIACGAGDPHQLGRVIIIMRIMQVPMRTLVYNLSKSEGAMEQKEAIERSEKMVRYIEIRDAWFKMYMRYIWAHYIMSGIAVILARFRGCAPPD